ncbi:hypothetical protein N7448_009676 [Penicillium atrosanguineum]|nr:hypothetical protein N7448_009676 [Penicillium atrosanguineum]
MSENFPVRPLLPEGASDILGNESAPFHCDWAVSGYTQPSPGFPANTDRFPSRDDPPSTDNRHGNAKVPIPRSAYPSSWTPTSGRVSRACENCREQKAKCSGHRPACQRCQDADTPCSYGDRKREKLLKQLDDLTTQVNTYETLLRELYPKLDSSSAQRVDQTLRGPLVRSIPSRLIELAPNFTPKNDQTFSSGSDLGTTGYPLITIDHTEEDFNRDEKIQAMGFVGEHSEMVWLYRLKRDLDQESATPASDNSDRPSISSLNYFQDDREISTLVNVDPTYRPPQELANALVNTYFEAVHPAFPVIGKTIFQSQYQSFYSSTNVRPGKRWLAVLNLIFAIASKYSLLVESQPLVNTGEDLVFFARAWRLSIGNVALDHPNLQQVQVEGLAAFYLLSTGQVNRSWRIIGIAIRSAVAMGLNLRNDGDSVAHLSKETRYRVWWALFMLDTVLCVMTGRPPSSDEVFCTTPLPIPYKEEEFLNDQVVQLIAHQGVRNYLMSSLLPSRDIPSGFADASTDRSSATHRSEQVTPNVSLYFLYAVDLAFLMRQAIEALYAPGAARRSWLEMETTITSLNNHADNWLTHPPPDFAFTELDTSQPFIRQRASLAFRFYTTKLIISQPCLRRVTNRSLGSTCDKMAAMCVQVASQMLDLLPDEADASWLYAISPWWCVLHYIMQSTTVLLIELFTRTQPGTSEAAVLATKLQKAVRWLREMATKDASSERAWTVCREIISTHGVKFALDIDF